MILKVRSEGNDQEWNWFESPIGQISIEAIENMETKGDSEHQMVHWVFGHDSSQCWHRAVVWQIANGYVVVDFNTEAYLLNSNGNTIQKFHRL